MKRDWGQLTIMLSGAFLIIFGVVMIIAQVLQQAQGGLELQPMQQQMTANKNGFIANTHYVGIELVMIGAVLQMVGFIGSRFSGRQTKLGRTSGVDE